MIIQKIESIGLTSEEIDILTQVRNLIYQIYINTEDDEITSYSRTGIESIDWILNHSKNIEKGERYNVD